MIAKRERIRHLNKHYKTIKIWCFQDSENFECISSMDVMYSFMWLTWFGEHVVNRYFPIDSRTFVHTVYDYRSCPVVHRFIEKLIVAPQVRNPHTSCVIRGFVTLFIKIRHFIEHNFFKIHYHIMLLVKPICLKWSIYVSRDPSNSSLI